VLNIDVSQVWGGKKAVNFTASPGSKSDAYDICLQGNEAVHAATGGVSSQRIPVGTAKIQNSSAGDTSEGAVLQMHGLRRAVTASVPEGMQKKQGSLT